MVAPEGSGACRGSARADPRQAALATGTGMPWDSGQVDLQREVRGGHGLRSGQYGLVHRQPWHFERGVLPAPRPGHASRDLGLVVTDGQSFFSEEKRDARSEIHVRRKAESQPSSSSTRAEMAATKSRSASSAIPDARWSCSPSPFDPLIGRLADYRVFALLAPHLGNCGAGTTAWVGDYKGARMLFAERGSVALALACSVPWLKMSVGFVGTNRTGGWNFRQHKQLARTFGRAANGNVALTERGRPECRKRYVRLGVGVGPHGTTEAAHQALASLGDGFDHARIEYEDEWREWEGFAPAAAAKRAADQHSPTCFV